VIWPAESIYDGTWASGPAPPELIDFEIMHEMGWSWEQLEATPVYVRQFTWDLMMVRREAERAATEKAKRENGRP
jgi:hypothetical protein